ncbi:protein FAM76A isoform X2 [Arctopsyche grandis]|uniref:protein FAM76A isoform X2 n=1 Tax=Arctopsyche grandis TaxID=121162 RepID=UPI00406D9125
MSAAANQALALFACSRCFSRHPFEELSPGQQLCKECRGAFPVVKCTYCRSEFQQTSKATSTICKKCEQNVKTYGKPTACEYCNTIAAFIGNKCQRCTNSERKYGPAVNCEQCKQRCAFDRQDDDKKIDGKLLCWLCTLSLKRALARTKQVESERRAHLKQRSHHKLKSSKRPSRDMNKGLNALDLGENLPLEKKTKPNPMHVDPNSSDHVVAMTQLKETIASLQKKLNQKDSQLLTKDKQITELKAQHFTLENELRNQMKNTEKIYDTKCTHMQIKIQGLLKEIATLSKTANRNKLKKNTENSGSGTDSPIPN